MQHLPVFSMSLNPLLIENHQHIKENQPKPLKNYENLLETMKTLVFRSGMAPKAALTANLDFGHLKAKIFGVASNANRKNHPACLQWLVLAFDASLNAVCIACNRLQFDAGKNCDTALFE